MSNFCVECGTAAGGGNFCGGCGRPLSGATSPAAPLTITDPAGQALSPAPRRTRRRGAVAVGAALALSIGALSAFAINSQAQTAADEQAAAEQAEQDAAAAAKAEKKRIAAKAERIAAKQVAEEREQMQAEQAQAAPPAPAVPAAASSVSATGGWEGSMDGGQYSFSMDLSESGGSISGSMYQYDSSDGEDGTQQLTGYRDGNTLYLQGTSWSGAPSTWSLDSIAVTLSSDGSSMSGSFTCGSCSGTKDISGYRVY